MSITLDCLIYENEFSKEITFRLYRLASFFCSPAVRVCVCVAVAENVHAARHKRYRTTIIGECLGECHLKV